MNKDLLWIKRHYSEKFAHLCRELFPTLLETEGLLPKILDEHFDHSKFLYDDIVADSLESDFKDYICSLNVEEDYEENDIIYEEPKVLMEKAGYDLYECKTEEDIQSFKKYYAPGEELCTFRGGRLKSCYVFFAVKKNVDEIKRKNFSNPERQDLYGTSVISIQFSKSENNNAISIKNRYNHTVNNPDSNFSNNLDNIIAGLRKSFAQKYGFKISKKHGEFEIPDYVEAKDGKYYKYAYEAWCSEGYTCYYCLNNVVLYNLEPKKYSNRYIVMDTSVLDLKEKIFLNYDSDSFAKSITSCGDIKKINIVNDKAGNREISLYIEKAENPIIIKIDEFGRIIEYINEYVKKIGDHFLSLNMLLEKIDLPNVLEIGTNFLRENGALEIIKLPNVRIIGDSFLLYNRIMKEVFLPNVVEIGDNFLDYNQILNELFLPNVVEIGDNFLDSNDSLTKIDLPKVKNICDGFMYGNEVINKISLPNVERIGNFFLNHNLSLEKIELPKCISIGECSMSENKKLKELSMPKVKEIGECSLEEIEELRIISLPSLQLVDNKLIYIFSSLKRLGILKKIELPSDIIELFDCFEPLNCDDNEEAKTKKLLLEK